MSRLVDEEIERDIEVGLAKMRLELKRIREKELEAQVDLENADMKRLKLSGEKERNIENGETEKEELLIDARNRQIFDPIGKVFDYSKRRVTDLRGENDIIYLPKLGETKYESELELVRSILMTEYKNYKEKKQLREKLITIILMQR